MKSNAASELPPDDDRRAILSALADGEAEAAAAGCAQWREDARARASWHAYHLIGDVMRSGDLASTPARDAAFLAGLRERLSQEAVVLAPAAVVAPARRQPLWLLPAAAAAGFVAVASVLVLLRPTPVPAGAPLLAAGGRVDPALRQAVNVGAPAAAPLVTEGRFDRDPQLDAYLRAHRDAFAWMPATPAADGPRAIEAMAPVAPTAAAPQR